MREKLDAIDLGERSEQVIGALVGWSIGSERARKLRRAADHARGEMLLERKLRGEESHATNRTRFFMTSHRLRCSLATILLLAAACASNEPIRCDDSSDCSQAGIGGQCLASPESSEMWCAFPDSACADSGLRWGILSGDGLARECVGGTLLGDGGLGFTVTVTSSGDGTGIVRSTPEGIDCGSVCSHAFPAGTSVELSATAAPAAFFEGWSGGCSGRDVCTVDDASAGTVGAEFLASGGTRWLKLVSTMSITQMHAGDLAPNGDLVLAGTGSIEPANGVMVEAVSSTTGEMKWTEFFPNDGDYYTLVSSLAVDAQGDVVVAGRLASTLDFDGTILTAPGGQPSSSSGAIFVAKLSGEDGSVVWAQSFGRTNPYGTEPHFLAIDASHNIYVTGTHSGSFLLGGTSFVDYGYYLAKLSPAGAVSWARAVAYGDVLRVNDIAMDVQGNIAMLGEFAGEVSFEGYSMTSRENSSDIFFAKYSASSGAYLFHNSFGSIKDDRAIDLATTEQGNAILLGEYGAPIAFGPGTLPGPAGFFVVELGSAGSHVRSFGISEPDAHPRAFAVDPTGELWVTGSFRAQIALGGPPLTAAGTSDTDGFLAKYDQGGVHRFSTRFGGVKSDGPSVLKSTSDAILLAGDFQGFAEFGAGTLTANNGIDTFLWSIVP